MMSLVKLEHSAVEYGADFALYGSAVTLMGVYLAREAPGGERLGIASVALCGLAAWTLIEYGMHRFVLHGLQPFSRWHAVHHQRPMALVYAPALLIVPSFVVLVFLPVLLLSDRFHACAATLGVVLGYLLYSVVHHATHHWSGRGPWIQARRRWHARHHRSIANPAYFGVSISLWDHVFGSAGRGGSAPAPGPRA